MLTDLAHHLASQGHRVTAVCSANSKTKIDSGPAPSVEIIEISSLGFSRRPLLRLASYASFLFGALRKSLFPNSKIEIVVTLTTPPLLSLIGTVLKKVRGVKHFIWEMDVYPDIATELGLMKRGSFATIFGLLADWTRRNADGVIALGEDMKDRLVQHGISSEKIHVAENWADGAGITPTPFPDGPVTIHYSGNLGFAHDVETIAALMQALRSDSRFRFVFAGGGPLRQWMETYCHERSITNVCFKPYCSRSALGVSLGEGHLGLVTQKSGALGSVVPSKTYGILAAGRPILYVGPRQAAPARIIHKFHCGWHFEPGDVKGLVGLLHSLVDNPRLLHSTGARARVVLIENYDRHIGVAKIARILGLDRHAGVQHTANREECHIESTTIPASRS